MDEEKIINSEQDSEEKTPVENQKQAERKFCVKCGAELDDGQLFCPKCGQKVGEKIELSSDKRINNGEMPIKRIIMAAIAVIALVAVVFIVRGTQAKSITLSKDNLTIKVGNMETLTYTIDPEKTKNKEVTWTSSSESIAKVNNGIVPYRLYMTYGDKSILEENFECMGRWMAYIEKRAKEGIPGKLKD
jgi:DNA-directed RNA polymerase subunit RPC12/RpoP